MARSVEDETTVNDSYSVTVPAAVRERADVEPGDKIRWSVDESGTVSIEVVKQRVGVFEDFEPASMGGDGATAHDTTGAER
jgi:bifunctional DNA-binding transcriptional regulator/antitoxin component of YhaV-PrlF toxin-antitoxin module